MAAMVLIGLVVAVTAGLLLAFRSSADRSVPREAEDEAALFWGSAEEEPREIVGGGGIFAVSSASRPFAVLQYGEAGIGLRMRGFAEGSIAFRWPEVVFIESAPRSVVVRALRARSFRFTVIGTRTLDPVLREAEAHQVAVEQVSSTVGWYAHPD